jgi:hypothetical protein
MVLIVWRGSSPLERGQKQRFDTHVTTGLAFASLTSSRVIKQKTWPTWSLEDVSAEGKQSPTRPFLRRML